MSLKDSFIAELTHEANLTLKMLDRVPIDNKDWRPHPKSMTIGRLATHIGETVRWAVDIVGSDEFDFLSRPFTGHTAESKEELLKIFQDNFDGAITALDTMNDDLFNKIWTVRRGEDILYTVPKKIAVRGWVLSHQIHHRGQLSVYLRMLDIPVPGMYGPSADER